MFKRFAKKEIFLKRKFENLKRRKGKQKFVVSRSGKSNSQPGTTATREVSNEIAGKEDPSIFSIGLDCIYLITGFLRGLTILFVQICLLGRGRS